MLANRIDILEERNATKERGVQEIEKAYQECVLSLLSLSPSLCGHLFDVVGLLPWHVRVLTSLKKRVEDLSGVEVRLLQSQRRAKEFQGQLRKAEEEQRLVVASKNQLMEYGELQRKSRQLEAEIHVLR